MFMLYAGLILAVMVLASAISVYVYARWNAAARGARQREHERRRRAVLDDFGDGAVWQMGQQATSAIGSGVPVGSLATGRGFMPRMAVNLLIRIAGRTTKPAVVTSGVKRDGQDE